MFTYIPSADLLLKSFQTLLDTRAVLEKAKLALDEEQRGLQGFHGGISEEDNVLKQRQRAWEQRYDQIHAQQDAVNNFLLPFDNEARQQKEDYEARRCAAMMRI